MFSLLQGLVIPWWTEAHYQRQMGMGTELQSVLRPGRGISLLSSCRSPKTGRFCREPSHQLATPHGASLWAPAGNLALQAGGWWGERQRWLVLSARTQSLYRLWYWQSTWWLSSNLTLLGQDKGWAWQWPGLPAPSLGYPCSGPPISLH